MEQLRQTAEILHSAQSTTQSPHEDISHSYSINTIASLHPDYLISDALLDGQRLNGRMSNVRRFFCMFVTFDLLFTGLMWLICIMLKGDIWQGIREQIIQYDVHKSLFDIVVVTVLRFLLLIIFYALIYLNHWFIISISTTLTCGFLIAKVFIYTWSDSQQQVFEVLLILISFILSWGEAWFLDFRVLPQEAHARRFLINIESERAPLIRSYVNGLQPSLYTESIRDFYSPLTSPEGSMLGFRTEAILGKYPPVDLTEQQIESYQTQARKYLQDSWDLYTRKDWKFERSGAGDSVHSISMPKSGKIFKLTANIDVKPRFLLDELFYRVETLPKWNKTVLESHKVQVISENTDVSYQIGAHGAGGAVSSRDFVNLRHWEFNQGCYIIAVGATEHPSLPKNDKYVRGENRAGCYVLQEDSNNPSKTVFHWVLNTDLKGWIPHSIIDAALVGMLLDYSKHLKQYILKQRENARL